MIDSLERQTQLVFGEPMIVPNGETIVLTITRTMFPEPGDTEARSVTSTLRFEASERGTWRTHYGFAFRADAFFPDQNFFADPAGANKYTIAQGADRDWLHFVPTIFYSWLSRARQSRDLAFTMGGGLGFDLSHPVVLLAPIGITYNQNLTLQLGVALASTYQLSSRYSVGDTIAENLTPEQLRQAVCRINPFLSISFAFRTNPFGGSPGEEARKPDPDTKGPP